MPAFTIIGVDPGETTGIALLQAGRIEVVQCSPGAVLSIVGALSKNATEWTAGLVIAVERFVVSTRAGRSASPKAGATTRALITALTDAHDPQIGVRVLLRSASEVKPWATDARLKAAGLIDVCKGMPHARDGARHALFAAVHDCGIPDPLSKRARGV